MQRIAVVGTTGSGKTTLTGELARRNALAHVELDSLFWGPNWTPIPLERFRAEVAAATCGERWATDGNYRQVRDLVWGRAEVLVWLDYALPLILWRLSWRTFRRAWKREPLWGKNYERWRDQLFHRDSLFLYALRSHHRWRAEYPETLRQPAYCHLQLVHLRSPRDSQAWLNS